MEEKEKLTELEKNERILFYAQNDFMVGLSEQLLDAKERRERVLLPAVRGDPRTCESRIKINALLCSRVMKG